MSFSILLTFGFLSGFLCRPFPSFLILYSSTFVLFQWLSSVPIPFLFLINLASSSFSVDLIFPCSSSVIASALCLFSLFPSFCFFHGSPPPLTLFPSDPALILLPSPPTKRTSVGLGGAVLRIITHGTNPVVAFRHLPSCSSSSKTSTPNTLPSSSSHRVPPLFPLSLQQTPSASLAPVCCSHFYRRFISVESH